MTRRTWLLLLTAVLGTGPLSACTWLDRRADSGGQGSGVVISPNDTTPIDRVAAQPTYSRPHGAPVVPQEPPKTLPEPEIVASPPVSEKSQPALAAPVQVVAPVVPPEPAEPVVTAFLFLLKNQPDAALDALRKYDPATQEIILRLLPPLAGLSRKGLDRMTPTEVAAFQDQLQGVHHALICRADLLLDKACFCESIESYGVYQPLPPEHRFQPPRGTQPGELVQLYVELRNFHSEPREGAFQTRLSSSVEVRDEKGAMVWIHNFQDRERPLRSLTARSNCFNNYSFYLPETVRPGRYQLTIQVVDQTREPHRTARKTVDFLVAAP